MQSLCRNSRSAQAYQADGPVSHSYRSGRLSARLRASSYTVRGGCDLRLVLVELDLDVRPDEIVRVAEGKKNGRSYIFGDNDTAQELVDNYSGKGEVKKENTESVTTDKIYGIYAIYAVIYAIIYAKSVA